MLRTLQGTHLDHCTYSTACKKYDNYSYAKVTYQVEDYADYIFRTGDSFLESRG